MPHKGKDDEGVGLLIGIGPPPKSDSKAKSKGDDADAMSPMEAAADVALGSGELPMRRQALMDLVAMMIEEREVGAG